MPLIQGLTVNTRFYMGFEAVIDFFMLVGQMHVNTGVNADLYLSNVRLRKLYKNNFLTLQELQKKLQLVIIYTGL